MSHIIGDGHTYYKLYNSLMDGILMMPSGNNDDYFATTLSNTIPKLIVERSTTHYKELTKQVGKQENFIYIDFLCLTQESSNPKFSCNLIIVIL